MSWFSDAFNVSFTTNGQLTYRLQGGQIVVEKQPFAKWITLGTAAL